MFSDVFKKQDESSRNQPEERPAEEKNKKESKTMSSTSGAILSEDVEFKGTLTFNSSLEINGKFEGEIHAEGPLTVGESAIVKGDIKAKSTVLLKGKMQGNITAEDRVEIAGSAHLYGDVKAPKFALSEGAIFVGSSDTTGGKKSGEFNNIFSKLGKESTPGSSGSSSMGSSSAGGSKPDESSKLS